MARNNRASGGAAVFSRDFFMLILFAIFVVAIFAALVWNMVIMHAPYSEMAASQHAKGGVDVAERGTIYDRNGEVIASSIESVTINVNPNDIDYSQAVTDEERANLEEPQVAVAKVFEWYLGETYGKTYDDYYEMVTRENTGYVIIQRKADMDIVDQMKEALAERNLIGVYYEQDFTRIYPNNEIGSQVIGAIDIDGNGVAGLELQYDELLAGVDGVIRVDRSDSGIPVAGGSNTSTPAVDGVDMMTSLDIKLQQKVESSLLDAIRWYEARGGSATVMDASTGEVYASCSFVRNPEEQEAGDEDYQDYIYDVGKLWGICDTYEPGSTFKAFTAYSVLENSDTGIYSTFTVPAALQVYDTVVTDSHEHGTEDMTLDRIIAESSNIGTVLAGRTVSNDTLYDTYHSLGIGQLTGIDFPGEAQGILEEPADWDGVQEANIMFGQGVSVTGIQLLRAYGALEQGGRLRVPHFLTSVANGTEETDAIIEGLNSYTDVVDHDTAENLALMLDSVVKWGTGTYASIPGYTVVGKTGTAEVADTSGSYIQGAYIVSFIGWLDNTDSDLICLVTLERPKTEAGGGPVCGPVFADIMSFAADRYHVTNNAG